MTRALSQTEKRPSGCRNQIPCGERKQQGPTRSGNGSDGDDSGVPLRRVSFGPLESLSARKTGLQGKITRTGNCRLLATAPKEGNARPGGT